MLHTLRNLRGNARAAVYTEPLWGIPFNLFATYVSIYMVALGLKARSGWSPALPWPAKSSSRCSVGSSPISWAASAPLSSLTFWPGQFPA
jgi:hypothetical protein